MGSGVKGRITSENMGDSLSLEMQHEEKNLDLNLQCKTCETFESVAKDFWFLNSVVGFFS